VFLKNTQLGRVAGEMAERLKTEIQQAADKM